MEKSKIRFKKINIFYQKLVPTFETPNELKFTYTINYYEL